jgi:hemerythrin-like metal-binding protein
MIEWNETYSVGIDEIDRQHKQLLKMVNRLIANPAVTVDSETISSLLTDMREYASMHFKTEEQYMTASEYPDLEQHKDQHREFRRVMLDLCMRTMAKDQKVPGKMMEYLIEWLVNHILHSDKKYGQFAGTCPAQHQHS